MDGSHHGRVEDDTPEMAALLRNLFAERGATLTWVAAELAERDAPVSVATLSYWCSGARRPTSRSSMRALARIEEIFDLPAGELTAKAMETRALLSPPPTFDESNPGIAEAVERVCRALGASPVDQWRVASLSAVVDVDDAGVLARRSSRVVIEATSQPVSRIADVWVPLGKRRGAYASMSSEAVLGGVSGETVFDEGAGVWGRAIDLSPPLAPGDATVLDILNECIADAPPSFQTGHYFAYPVREFVLTVRFAQEAIPDWAEEVSMVDGVTKLTFREISEAGTVNLIRSKFGPGGAYLRWGFDDVDDEDLIAG